MIKSDNRRNFNELRRLFVYMPPCLGVHTDTAETLKILPTGYNMATEKKRLCKIVANDTVQSTHRYCILHCYSKNYVELCSCKNSA